MHRGHNDMEQPALFDEKPIENANYQLASGKTPRIVLGLDVAFASLGWCAARVGRDRVELAGVGVVRTKPGEAALLKSEDNFQRLREIYRGLEELRAKWEPVGFAVEAQSWPRNAGAVAKIGMAWGVVASIAALWDLPVIHQSPQRIKKVTAGRNDASKDEVRAGLLTMRGFERLEDMLRAAGIPSSYWEHPVDAAGAIYAALDTELGRTLRSAA
jgi:Holliday junction resolvasome RuvABC endonuclease subunit